jgi:hypothetical protein
MQKYTASVIWLVCLMVGLASTWSQAAEGVNLSAADEQAYQEAQAAWKRLVDVHEEAGIPPPTDPPKREDFIDYAAQRAEAAAQDAATRIEAEARWQQRVNEAQPYLRSLIRREYPRAGDSRTVVAQDEKEHLLRAADEKWAKRDEVDSAKSPVPAAAPGSTAGAEPAGSMPGRHDFPPTETKTTPTSPVPPHPGPGPQPPAAASHRLSPRSAASPRHGRQSLLILPGGYRTPQTLFAFGPILWVSDSSLKPGVLN